MPAWLDITLAVLLAGLMLLIVGRWGGGEDTDPRGKF